MGNTRIGSCWKSCGSEVGERGEVFLLEQKIEKNKLREKGDNLSTAGVNFIVTLATTRNPDLTFIHNDHLCSYMPISRPILIYDF